MPPAKDSEYFIRKPLSDFADSLEIQNDFTIQGLRGRSRKR